MHCLCSVMPRLSACELARNGPTYALGKCFLLRQNGAISTLIPTIPGS